MTKGRLDETEKAILVGISAVFNLDICDSFECPDGGCDECPLRRVCVAQEKMIEEINNLVGEMGR